MQWDENHLPRVRGTQAVGGHKRATATNGMGERGPLRQSLMKHGNLLWAAGWSFLTVPAGPDAGAGKEGAGGSWAKQSLCSRGSSRHEPGLKRGASAGDQP